jgi:cation-transporting ATPase 13A1
MITGDNALTACHIAGEVEIVKRPCLIADVWNGKLEWRTIDEKISFSVNISEEVVPTGVRRYDLCCTGAALALLEPSPLYKSLLPLMWVYARVSPSQKEMILLRLKDAGYCTLMAGDGTNDVGALKQAHVGIFKLTKGIALLDGTEEDLKKIASRQLAIRKKLMLEKQEELKRRWAPDAAAAAPKPSFTVFNYLI